MKKQNATEKKPDLLLLLATLLLATIGTVMIYSASSILAMERFHDGQFFLKKQLLFLALGLAGMAFSTRVHYYKLQKLAWPGIIFSAFLLVLLKVPHMGIKAGGAVRWLNLGIFSFQVSEMVKIVLIIFLASYLAQAAGHVREFKKGILLPLGVTVVMIGLIFSQPDFGTAAILSGIAFIMIYLAGGRIIHLAGLVSLFIPVALWMLFHQKYRIARWTAFLDPWKDPQGSGFQIIQSMISFGSGGVFGVGIGDSMQKLFYLPEPHTDFILSVIAEEGGFLGVAAILLLYIIIILRGFKIALKAPDVFGNLLAAGLTMLIALEAFINIAGVMGIVPLKGLALPFLSYGGTSLIMSLILVGILLNISSYED
ncbi:MAG: putative lipid II flippase FtsW [Syntrophobacterales bacterium]|nr:putative lipid II flippase FtsW [Syntrophobacterales bacterium]